MAPNKGRDVSTGREFIADTRRWWNDARLDALNGEHGQGMSGWWDKSTDTPPTDPIRGKSPPPSRNVDRRNKIQSRNSTSCSVAVLQMSERFRKNAHWHLYIVPTPNVNRGKWLHRKSRWRAGKIKRWNRQLNSSRSTYLLTKSWSSIVRLLCWNAMNGFPKLERLSSRVWWAASN